MREKNSHETVNTQNSEVTFMFFAGLMERMKSLREREKMAKVREVGLFIACMYQVNTSTI